MTTWRPGGRPLPCRAARTVRSEVPLPVTSRRMPSSISVEPRTVKKTNRLDASARTASLACSSPNRVMRTHIGMRTSSKAMKNPMASRVTNVASAANSTSSRQA